MKIVYQYAVKFVCGKSEGRVVAPGRYWTAINVHNPAAAGIKFRKRIAIALPNEKAGCRSGFFSAKLGAGEALEIDCEDIFRHVRESECEHDEHFLKGFVVIESETELDVVTVYTASEGDELETLHTERVPARRMTIGLPDLVPVPDKYGQFCKLQDGKLIVTVKNQGAETAGPSVTEVDFFSIGKVSLPTPSIAAGGSVNMAFKLPRGCYNPDCNFRIRVNATGSVVESNSGNNFASGTCIG